MQKNLKKDAVFVLAAMVAFLVLLIFALPAAAAVSVYAEGAYTADDLVVYIYADIDTDAICSAGVKLTYDSGVLSYSDVTPDDNPIAEKNDEVWFMGDGSTNYPYMNPEVADGNVVFICGKLDTSTSTSPTDGVIGGRVLLGKVTFSIKDAPIETPVDNPETTFGISVELGRGGDFANFVTTGGDKLDGSVDFTSIGTIVRERGDANASGEITSADMFKIRSMLASEEYIVYADCNDSGEITSADMFCVRSKLH